MFELVLLKRGRYVNDVQVYQYSSIYNLMKEVNKWLEEKSVLEEEIYSIRWRR